MDANTEKGLRPEVQGKDVPEGLKKPRFIVVSELLFQVDSLADVPRGKIVVEAPNGDFKEFETGRIPTEKLLEGIAAGNVYAHWGANVAKLDELHPNWAQCAIGKPRTPVAFERQWPYSERPVRVPAVADRMDTDGPGMHGASVVKTGSELDDRSPRLGKAQPRDQLDDRSPRLGKAHRAGSELDDGSPRLGKAQPRDNPQTTLL